MIQYNNTDAPIRTAERAEQEENDNVREYYCIAFGPFTNWRFWLVSRGAAAAYGATKSLRCFALLSSSHAVGAGESRRKNTITN